jgi:hypothetical protein
MNQTS